MSGRRVTVEPAVLVYAFRYALGRRTGAPGDVATALIEHGDALSEYQRDQIAAEIIEAMKHGAAGDPPDISSWWSVLKAWGRAS